ncbi:MAG: 5-methyltetrahydropteroyltriglutamate--homocysteine methyltransferase [Gemmatales bacterium]|nr:MAG: 5-methyltetrahydropteroyltriglutamate--homocysteine methyltransferase [Gemmatales bacterium]
MASLPLFPVTMVGSWPRTPALLRAQKQKRINKLSVDEFERLADAAIADLIRVQHELGIDIITDGEQRRDNFYSFVAEKLDGVRLMTLAEMLDIVEDKAGFEQILQTLDVPAYSLSNPTCVGRISRRRPLAVDELRFLKRTSDRPVKIPLPGPYLLTRAMFVAEVTRQAYPTKEALAEDVVAILRAEVADLIAEGVDFIQLDEPVLTEVAFNPGKTRTFMCASLAARGDPSEELEFARTLINQVVEGMSGPVFGVHVCRGNWSQNESILLEGNYQPLASCFHQLKIDQLVLEYATRRAGDLLHFPGKSLGLGVVNPRTPEVESVDAIVACVKKALTMYAPRELYLNPDCGFGTFSNSPVNQSDIAIAKMKAIVTASRRLRAEYEMEQS